MRSILFSLLGLLLLTGSCTKKLNSSGKIGSNHIRVMSYNIHHANPPARPNVIDLDAIAAVIRAQKPDVVMLQELDVHTGRSGKSVDEATELGTKTGLKSYFIKAIDHDGGDYGVAILSKYEMTNLRRIRIPTDSTTKGEPRVLGLATVTLPNGKLITLACTHLDAQRAPINRHLQATEIARVLKQETHPVILAGDFNDTPDSETLRLLTSVVTSSCKECPPTIPVENSNKTIDFITFAPKDAFQVVEHKVIPERIASDHLPVVAEITY